MLRGLIKKRYNTKLKNVNNISKWKITKNCNRIKNCKLSNLKKKFWQIKVMNLSKNLKMKHIKQSKKKNFRNYKEHRIFQIIYPAKYKNKSILPLNKN